MLKLGTTRRRRFRRRLVVVASAALLLAGGTASAQVVENVTSSNGLVYSKAASVSGAKQLSRATVSGKIFVFLPQGAEGVTRVQFHLDDPSGAKEPVSVSTAAPFGLSTGGIDTTKLRNGVHTVLAVITSSSGNSDLFARFTVKNANTGGTAAPGTSAAPGTGTGAAPGTGAGTSPAVRVGTREVWKGDFENGDLSQWGNCQAEGFNGKCKGNVGNRITVVPGKKPGSKAARFELHPGDKMAGGERSEVAEGDAPGPGSKEGDEYWFEWSTLFDKNFKNPSGWFLILQWHSDSGSPPIAVQVTEDGKIIVTKDGSNPDTAKPLGTVRPGVWTDFVLHIKFSRNASVGFIEGWENGKQTLPKWNRPTLRDGDNYLKHGIYRDGDSNVAVVTHDGVRITAP